MTDTASAEFFLFFGATLLGMLLLAVRGTRSVRDAADFSLAGRRSGQWQVAGGIMGTLVGGASTVGTVQLAFLYGFSAWWFTLGSGIACAFLALALVPPLRQGGVTTIPQFIARYHGERSRAAASLFSALGMFIHIMAQLLACGAILATLFNLSTLQGSLVSALLVAVFALCGGMSSAGPLGIAKLLLLYLIMALSGALALRQAGGWSPLASAFPPFPWFSLFGYGVGRGVSDLISMLVGVVSTQTYIQAVLASRDVAAARRGALISAVLIPPLGLMGIVVGLFMRHTRPELESARALPVFVLQYLPQGVAGMAFAALLIAAVATAAGLTLGVGTTIKVDLLARLRLKERQELAALRLMTLLVVLCACLILLANLDAAIMQWSFLSMGLRGATLCLPLLAAVFLRERTSRLGGFLSIWLAPLAVLAAGFGGSKVPPLLVGLSVSLAAFALGKALERRGRERVEPSQVSQEEASS